MTSIGTYDHAAAFVPAVMRQAFLDPIRVEDERPGDAAARESLLDRAFGPARFRKTCERLRAGRLPARGLSLVARARKEPNSFKDLGGAQVGSILGSVRLWHVDAGGVAALMLGPLAVDDCYRCFGIGARLMDEALVRAKALGHRAVILVGDAPYYARFGFARAQTVGLRLPGPVDEARFLGLDLEAGALASAAGMVEATGAVDLTRRREVPPPKLRKAA